MKTERLVLELPNPSDGGRVAAYFRANAHHLDPWSPNRPDDFLTTAYWDRQLARNLEEANSDRGFCFYFRSVNEPDGSILGNAELTAIARGPFQACYLGFSIAASHQGQGYMREALTEVIDFAFEDLELHRLMAAYRPTNARSGALLKRLGFQVEGYARDYLFIDGAWRDHILTALIRPPEKIPPP